jgi:non-canonical poly(A) RNA polymerase PAPD5/7
MGDSYRPSRRSKGRGGGASLASRITFENGSGDSYRPNDAQTHHHQPGGQNRGNTEFTFTAGGSGPQFPPTGPAADSRPATRRNRRGRGGSGPSQHQQRSSESTTIQAGGRHNQNGFQRGGRRPWKKQQPHERPLLQSRDDTGSEHILGDTDGTNKFLNLEDLSEDETDMDLDTDDASEEGAINESGPSRKKVRADGDSISIPAPKWSNPDPYTVLPPPDETTGKKRDVVKLIRKAKNQASEKAASSNAVAANDDFISFNFDDDDDDDEPSEEDDDEAPMWAPNPHSNYPVRGSLNEAVPTGPASMVRLPAKPPPQRSGARNHKRKHAEGDGVDIIQEWQADTRMDPAPWVQDYAHLRDDMSKW